MQKERDGVGGNMLLLHRGQQDEDRRGGGICVTTIRNQRG